ncbi:helix-turn-helix transcriptional regulator [Streptomyces sp.]|uniref:helix-turn-helix transcriptional regulator n=1 Tax=Streptomyces sp. TaxID=1931 RepID=UPI002F408956
MTEHDLFEREEELALLCDLFHDSLKGRSRMAVVTGAAGHGKSELLGALAEYAARLGAVHLSATASRAEQSVPFGVLGQFFRGTDLPEELRSHVAALLGRALLAAADDTGPPADTEGISPLMFHQIGLALHDLTEHVDGPLLLSIDDVQYADAPSLQCLSAVVRRLRSAPLTVVLNECPAPWPSGAMLKAELPPEPMSRRIRLRPLSRHGVEALLDRHLGQLAAFALGAECLSVTGGNPLLVRRLIKDTAGQGPSAPHALRVGPHFEQAVLDCLYRCHPSVRTAAREVAVLDDPQFAPLLIRLSELDPRSLSLALDTLTEAGFLVDGQWRHSRARAAVLQGMTAGERAALHNRAATVLFKNGAPVIAVAHQLIAADSIDNDCAAAVLLEAADESLHGGDGAFALNCLSLAHRYSRNEEHRATTTAMLFRAEWRADPRAAARRMPALLGYTEAGLLTGRHVAAPVESLMWFGQPQAALDAVDRLESHIRRSQDVEASAYLKMSRIALGVLYPAPAGDPENESDSRGGDPSAADSDADADPMRWAPSCCCQAVSELHRVLRHGPDPLSVRVAEQTLSSYKLNDHTVLLLAAAVGILILNDEVASAERWLTSFTGTARTQSAPAWHALFESLAAKLALRRGDLKAAVRMAESALAEIPAASWGVVIGLPLSVVLEANALLDTRTETLAHLRMAPPAPMFQTPFGLRYLYARGRLLLAHGQPTPALEDLTAVGELAARWGMDVPALLPWRTDAARVHLARGESERARELLREQLTLVAPGQHLVRAATLRALAAATSGRERGSLLARAVEAAQSCGNPVELAFALNDMGQHHQELGQYSKGRIALRRARQLAEECGVALPGRIAPEPTGGTPAATPGGGEHLVGMLSDAEMRVVTLAARGHSNRQIAAKLFVTVSTVEQHLTRVYRKLGIKRRSDLAPALHRGAMARRAS